MLGSANVTFASVCFFILGRNACLCCSVYVASQYLFCCISKFFFSLSEIQNAKGIMDVLAEMLSAIEPGNREVRRFTSRERCLYLFLSVELVQNIIEEQDYFSGLFLEIAIVELIIFVSYTRSYQDDHPSFLDFFRTLNRR